MGYERDTFSSTGREPPRLDGTGAASLSRDAAPAKRERDWKRSVLIAGLGTLSWVATYVGMLELIEANMGNLPLIHKMIIGFSVAMLMIMIIWLLDQLFKPHPFIAKAFYAFGYVFLSLISVGFGFGFYWKVLESRGEASRSAESAVGSVQSSLHAASTRLEQLQATLMQLTQVSSEKAQLERTKGTSCPNSKPGDGPRRKLRDEDAQRFQFSSEFVKGRVSSVKTELSALNDDMIRIVSDDPTTVDAKTGTRNEFMRALSRKLDLTVTGFNAFRTDPQLKQMRADLADRAERTTFSDNRGGTFACPDPQLQTALRGVVKAIDQLPELEKPQIAAVEGSEATIEAFRRLTATFYGALSFKLPPSSEDMRELQKKAVQSVENAPAESSKWNVEQSGLSKRDYVPLAVALFVDLCLFLVSMVQTPRSRLSGLVPKMQSAESGPIIDILSRFNDIHKDQQIRENFEIFRHVVFDMNGDYYVAVPLDAPPRLNPAEREALRVEAQLLANLFASFEKEKIFKRTLLPTTGSVQKRLKRQGSKFAGSEAFRVYKFTDGAWSDIILGAVMGAAKRAEDDKRVFPSAHLRPRPLEAVSVDAAPVAALPSSLTGALTGTMSAPAGDLPPPPRALPASPLRPAPAAAATPAPSGGRSASPIRPVPMTGSAASASPATGAPRTVPPVDRSPVSPTTAPPRPYRMPSLTPAAPVPPPHAEDVARFGPYAPYAAPRPTVIEPMPPQAPRVSRPIPPTPLPEADVSVRARALARDDLVPGEATQPARTETPEASVVVALPSSQPGRTDHEPAPAEIISGEAAARDASTAATGASVRTGTTAPRSGFFPVAEPARSGESRDDVTSSLSAPPTVDVTLARETATFSIPVSGMGGSPASLQHAIARMSSVAGGALAATENEAARSRETAQIKAQSKPLLEPRLELVPLDQLEDPEPEDINGDPLSDRDLAIISRMAPPAAE